MLPGVDMASFLRYSESMSEFPFPAEPTPKQTAFEDTLIRWGLVIVPLAIAGKILGLLAIVAILIACNYNILTWIE